MSTEVEDRIHQVGTKVALVVVTFLGVGQIARKCEFPRCHLGRTDERRESDVLLFFGSSVVEVRADACVLATAYVQQDLRLVVLFRARLVQAHVAIASSAVSVAFTPLVLSCHKHQKIIVMLSSFLSTH